jgi:hypothetical protein
MAEPGDDPASAAGAAVRFNGAADAGKRTWGFLGDDRLYWVDWDIQGSGSSQTLAGSWLHVAGPARFAMTTPVATLAGEAVIDSVPAADGSTLYTHGSLVATDGGSPTGYALHAVATAGGKDTVLAKVDTATATILALDPAPQGHALVFALGPWTCWGKAPTECDQPVEYVLVIDPAAAPVRLTGLREVTWAPDAAGLIAIEAGQAIYVPLEAPQEHAKLAAADHVHVPGVWPAR